MKVNKGGRPPTGRLTGRKVTVYMQPGVEKEARSIGDGNLSAGVAKAVGSFRETQDALEGALNELVFKGQGGTNVTAKVKAAFAKYTSDSAADGRKGK